jgi:hypothetical protein
VVSVIVLPSAEIVRIRVCCGFVIRFCNDLDGPSVNNLIGVRCWRLGACRHVIRELSCSVCCVVLAVVFGDRHGEARDAFGADRFVECNDAVGTLGPLVDLNRTGASLGSWTIRGFRQI